MRKNTFVIVSTCVVLMLAVGMIIPQQPIRVRAELNTAVHRGFENVPTNLQVVANWIPSAKKSNNVLTWDPSEGAVSYNVYAYDIKIATTTQPTYTVAPENVNGNITYSVTAIDHHGRESRRSVIALAGGMSDPDNLPNWHNGSPPGPPQFLRSYSEWNLGKPRILVTWERQEGPYAVYRDGVQVAYGLSSLYYVDNNVTPGATYSYEVTAMVGFWPGRPESVRSAKLTATALLAQPQPLSQKVTVTGVMLNDDSAMVKFNAVPGARDYRIYKAATPYNVKYMGWLGDAGELKDVPLPTSLSIEMNGLNVNDGDVLIVEAVDKLGPFQKMDGNTGEGGMHHAPTNGHGDPSNVPNVLARSDAFHVKPVPRTLTGAQAFFDTFRSDPNMVKKSVMSDPVLAKLFPPTGFASGSEFENNNWIVRNYAADEIMTTSFTNMGQHFMDTLYDGPSFGTSFSHNNNSSTVVIPKKSVDISGGKVLHVTMEVDAHFNGRRWTDIFLVQTGDSLLRAEPTKMDASGIPTTSGALLNWEIIHNHSLFLYLPVKDETGKITGNRVINLIDFKDYADQMSTNRSFLGYAPNETFANGRPDAIDKRSRFDLFISKNHFKIVETFPDGTKQLVREADFPAGVELPFEKITPYYVHELYHTGNDRPEMVAYAPQEQFWYNHRPWADERHWDNMGFEVLDNFSQANVPVLPTVAPTFVEPESSKALITATKSADKTVAKVGDLITYTLLLENKGAKGATNIQLKDALPTNVSFVSATEGGQVNNGFVTWKDLSLGAGLLKTITLVVRVK